MRKIMIFVLCLTSLFIIGCTKNDNIAPELKASYPSEMSVSVSNKTQSILTSTVFEIPASILTDKAPDFNPKAFLVLDNGNEVPSQAIDLDADGAFDKVAVSASFKANEKKNLIILYSESGENPREYPKMTQAEVSHKFGGRWENRKYIGGDFRNVDFIRVPSEHTDHSTFFRYEGPGWESDKVGYRYYHDWRCATDIYGKKTTDMVLQDVGQDGYDSYHEMADWGMDVLKVGGSLGIGTLGMLGENGKVNRIEVTDSATVRIAENGSIYSQIRTQFFGWTVEDNKYDVVSDLSIVAGSRMTRHEVTITGTPQNLCTGIVKHPDATLFRSSSADSEWSYIANYGKQSLAEDNLGMAVLYKTSDLIEVTEDDQSHVVSLKPTDGKLIYYFLGAWEKEPSGIQTEDNFIKYLDETISSLNTPIVVE